MNRRLFRSPDDRILAGVAGGMAETYDFDPAVVRVMWALLILLSGGVFLILYIVMALVVPLRAPGMATWAAAMPAGSSTGPGGATEPAPGMPPSGPPSPGSPPGYATHYRRRDGSGALVIGLILILAGAFFLARQYIPGLNAVLSWPVIVIGVGLLLIVFAFGRGRTES